MACARATQMTPVISEPKLRGHARSLSVVAAAAVCFFLLRSTSQVASLLLGTALFLLAQALQPDVDRVRRLAPKWRHPRRQRKAPSPSGQAWEAEVEERILQLTPTAETIEAVVHVADAVRGVVQPLMPGAEVVAFVGASLSSGKAFGVAVPEFDIVISAAPEARKSVVRACTSRLVGLLDDDDDEVDLVAWIASLQVGFNFGRSAFPCEEPKVVLISPPWLHSISFNLSINTVTAAHNAAVLAGCARVEPRVQGFVLLVRRWAKGRGLCHPAQGHLSLYSWTLLSIYFLQVGEAALLPPMRFDVRPQGFDVSPQDPAGPRAESVPVTDGCLLRAFFRFYSLFDWHREAVSVRAGTRGAPGAHLCIEDPFNAAYNMGACLTSTSLCQLRAELERADQLCTRGDPLAELLETWAETVGGQGDAPED